MNYVKKEFGSAVEVYSDKRITVVTSIDASTGAPMVLSVVEGEVSDESISQMSLDCGPVTMNVRTLEFVVLKHTGKGSYVPIEDGPISERDVLQGRIFNVGLERLERLKSNNTKHDKEFSFKYSKSGKA